VQAIESQTQTKGSTYRSSPGRSFNPGDCELDPLLRVERSGELGQRVTVEMITQHCNAPPVVPAAPCNMQHTADGRQLASPTVCTASTSTDTAHTDRTVALQLGCASAQPLETACSAILSAQETAVSEMNRKLRLLDEAYSALVRERKEVMALLSSPATPTATSEYGDEAPNEDSNATVATECAESDVTVLSAPEGVAVASPCAEVAASPTNGTGISKEKHPHSEMSGSNCETPVCPDRVGTFGQTPHWCCAPTDRFNQPSHAACTTLLLHTPLESPLPSLSDDLTGDLGKQCYSLDWMAVEEHSAAELEAGRRCLPQAKPRLTSLSLRVVALAVVAARRFNRVQRLSADARRDAPAAQAERARLTRPPKARGPLQPLSACALTHQRKFGGDGRLSPSAALPSASPLRKGLRTSGADADAGKENMSACASNRHVHEHMLAEDGSTAAALNRCKSLESQVLEYAMFHQKRPIGTRMRDSAASSPRNGPPATTELTAV
jgi:hypothetical protein